MKSSISFTSILFTLLVNIKLGRKESLLPLQLISPPFFTYFAKYSTFPLEAASSNLVSLLLEPLSFRFANGRVYGCIKKKKKNVEKV